MFKKRIFSLLMALAMVLSITSVAFAAEGTESSPECIPASVATSDEGIMPLNVVELRTVDMHLQGNQDYTVWVTPEKGTNLKMIAACSGGNITTKVYKNGGWWASKTVTITGNTTQFDLINNCNGEPYKFVFEIRGSVNLYAKIVSTDYV